MEFERVLDTQDARFIAPAARDFRRLLDDIERQGPLTTD
jgi:hypothetical protein